MWNPSFVAVQPRFKWDRNEHHEIRVQKRLGYVGRYEGLHIFSSTRVFFVTTVLITLRIDIGSQNRVESPVTCNGRARPTDEENRALTRYVDPSERCKFQNDDRQPTQGIG